MENELTKDQLLLESLYKGVYYYNKFGEVFHFITSDVNLGYITCKYGRKKFYFGYDDFGKKCFLSHEMATKKAQEYIEEVTKYISLKTLKKIVKLKEGCTIFLKNEEGVIDNYTINYYDTCYYDKIKKAFVIINEYADFGDEYFDEDDSISNYLWLSLYGKRWALTKEELLNDERRKRG